MPKNKKGLFIVLYGINNLGKSTQAQMLVDRFKREGKKAVYIKYPIYDLEPTGSILNDYLRAGNPYNLSVNEFQILQTLNKTHFEQTLTSTLHSGTIVVAEDYVGTSLAWGIGGGSNPYFLKHITSHLKREDVAFLFTGKRFMTGKENNHLHEDDGVFTQKVADTHLKLAKEYGWHIIDANRSRGTVNDEMWSVLEKEL